MNISFIVLLHEFSTTTKLLLEALLQMSKDIVIHWDKRVCRDARFLSWALENRAVNVFSRYNIYWGDYSIIKATRLCMKMMNERKGLDYVFLLSGTHSIIKSQSEIYKMLSIANGRSFIQYAELPWSEWEGGGYNRVESLHIRYGRKAFVYPAIPDSTLRKIFNIFGSCMAHSQKRRLRKVKVYGGRQWWGLSMNHCNRILAYLDQNDFIDKIFRNAYAPDEMYFQTVLGHLDLLDSVVNNSMCYADWHRKEGRKPAILDDGDYALLMGREEIFARKFVDGQSEQLQRRILIEKGYLDENVR